MYNGYDFRLVDSHGAARCGIEHVRDKKVGRGVLLDVAGKLSVNLGRMGLVERDPCERLRPSIVIATIGDSHGSEFPS